MQKLLRDLRRRGISPADMDALEAFGADGSRQTVDYFREVRSLEVWELDPKYLPALQQNLPGAKIKITDSFEEIKTTSNTYDFVVLDEPGQLFIHRDIEKPFPMILDHVFRVLRSQAVIVVNLFPDLSLQKPDASADPAYPRYLERRKQFYGVENPEFISVQEMVPAYKRSAEENGFTLADHAFFRRTVRTGVYYLMLLVRRKEAIA